MTEDTRPIAVIGAGFSGTIVARHLLERLRTRRILLCERGPTFARGAAYSTDDPVHLLNVRAENMSAFSARPDDFVSWLERRDDVPARHVHHTPVGIFVSRALYGQYLTSLLQDALADNDGATRLRIVPDEVVRLDRKGEGGFVLHLAGGRTHEVAGAILAIGNPAADPRQNSGICIRDPWSARFAEGLEPDRPVVVVGSGLSMVDIVSSLWVAGFPGPVLSISRRGLVPRMHVLAAPWRLREVDPLGDAPLSEKLRALRAEIRAAASAGVPWQSVIDALRPQTAAAWRRWPKAEQERFLRHLRPWWDVHRHRMAPPIGQQFRDLVTRGFLRVEAGHVTELAERDGSALVRWVRRGRAETCSIEAQRVIVATGAPPAAHAGDTLLSRLLEAGEARLDGHGLGLDVTDGFAVIRPDGTTSSGLWALGPIARGTFWECTAVPDIRRDAEAVADVVAARFPRAEP